MTQSPPFCPALPTEQCRLKSYKYTQQCQLENVDVRIGCRLKNDNLRFLLGAGIEWDAVSVEMILEMVTVRPASVCVCVCV